MEILRKTRKFIDEVYPNLGKMFGVDIQNLNELSMMVSQELEKPSVDAELLSVAESALAWIDGVPDDVVLPVMEGFDRDWADGVISRAKGESREA